MPLLTAWRTMDTDEAVKDPLHQHIFALFSIFSERNGQAGLKSQQGEFIIDELLREAGRPTTSKRVDMPDDVTYRELLNLLQLVFPDRNELQPTTSRVFERYVNHVIAKGFILFRKVYSAKPTCIPRPFRNWTYGWCSIGPGKMSIWEVKKKPKEISIDLDHASVVENALLDKDRYTFSVTNGLETIQFAHFDHTTARAFIRDLRMASDHCTNSQLRDFDLKRSLRTRIPDKEAQLRLNLEKERTKLEQQLEEERQNRKDEEIVRGLATRMLEEERQKSEQMQRVLAELQTKLLINGDEPTDGPPPNDSQSEADSERVIEKEETEITLRSREDQLRHYAYHLFCTQNGGGGGGGDVVVVSPSEEQVYCTSV